MIPATERETGLRPEVKSAFETSKLTPWQRLWRYGGLRFHCPVCRGWFRKMLPHGINLRQNARCPACLSLERHRLLWLYLKNRTDFFKRRMKILHVAPEPVLSKILSAMPSLDYVSVDLYSRFAMLRMDITDLRTEDNLYDAVLCLHVFEHIQDDRKAMRELFRVLKPGGWAILQVPIFGEITLEIPAVTTSEERTEAYGHPKHLRQYGLDYLDRLEEAGFKVQVDDYVKSLGPRRIARYGLKSRENIYFCRKSGD
ncbi:MAG: hypothetical protein A2Z83_04265 [Omnitrophica bacterium GWA2_52_8]|nr:MAG: hypothetical protein A2Z83_04265 [Omnitrophica bacterium GWA2_52_8]